MARAYIVLTRNDLDNNMLQVLDLKPNATPSQGSVIYGGSPQGGYQSFYLLDGVNAAVTTAGAGPITIAATTYGLSAYLIDRVENSGAPGDPALTAAEAVAISGLIEAAASAGTALTLAAINVMINTPAGVSGSDLDGTLGNSLGTVEEVLRILAGERYRIPAAYAVEDVANAFVPTIGGAFVTAPVVELPSSVRGTYGAVHGRLSNAPMAYIRPGVPRTAAVQTGVHDVNFNNVRATVDTGDLHLSATNGVLADLNSATFTWLNPGNAYTAAAVTAARPRATTLAAANIPATGIFRAITIYDASGNVI